MPLASSSRTKAFINSSFEDCRASAAPSPDNRASIAVSIWAFKVYWTSFIADKSLSRSSGLIETLRPSFLSLNCCSSIISSSSALCPFLMPSSIRASAPSTACEILIASCLACSASCASSLFVSVFFAAAFPLSKLSMPLSLYWRSRTPTLVS